jgi:hypothetical protein
MGGTTRRGRPPATTVVASDVDHKERHEPRASANV